MIHNCKLIKFILLLLLLIYPSITFGEPLEDYEQSRKLYLAAAASRAAYSDRIGAVTFQALEELGYEIETFSKIGKKADAHFLLAKPQLATEHPLYIVAFAGTQTLKDIQVDLNYNKVYFSGTTYEEFEQYANQSNIPETKPKVHKGFHEYVQNALTVEKIDADKHHRQRLSELLLQNKDIKVLFVGHSLGGAAATLGAARFLSMGLDPNQIEVITFGAPAVGNSAFCQEFEQKLNLTRVTSSGDAIPRALQSVVGGYQQFGQKIHWDTSYKGSINEHQIAAYMDAAIKNYYEKRNIAIQNKVINSLPTAKEPYEVYIAPIKFNNTTHLIYDYPYMREALLDEYRKSFSSYMIDDNEPVQSSFDSVFNKAEELNSRYVVFSTIEVNKIKNKRNTYYISLQQILYTVSDRKLVTAACYSSTTSELTPLEVLMYNARFAIQDIK